MPLMLPLILETLIPSSHVSGTSFSFFSLCNVSNKTIFISEYLALIISPSPYFVGLQQIKEKPRGWSSICKDPSYKNGSRDIGSMDPDVQLCHCIESTIIEIINMSVSGI